MYTISNEINKEYFQVILDQADEYNFFKDEELFIEQLKETLSQSDLGAFNIH